MPLYAIFEKIFLVLIVGVFVGIWKIFKSIGGAVDKSIERKQAQIDSEKAFGKLDQNIEIYDPSEGSKNAD